jgi:hypothetical protein
VDGAERCYRHCQNYDHHQHELHCFCRLRCVVNAERYHVLLVLKSDRHAVHLRGYHGSRYGRNHHGCHQHEERCFGRHEDKAFCQMLRCRQSYGLVLLSYGRHLVDHYQYGRYGHLSCGHQSFCHYGRQNYVGGRQMVFLNG